MPDFDYCTAQEAFAYGDSDGGETYPSNAAALMAEVVTAVSRAIDVDCNQRFSAASYVDHVRRGQIDPDGILLCHPAVPTMSAPTALAVQIAPSREWTAMDLTEVEIEESSAGCVLRAYSPNLLTFRGARVRVKLTFDGGYADRDALPAQLRWGARALAWLTMQRRTAPMNQTAMPELGIVINPGVWPEDIRRMLLAFKKVTP